MSESIGARLRQARELRRLTIAQVSETTKLRAHYLQALENDDYSAIPSAAQARGFLRLYAGFLELEIEELLPAAAPAEPATPEAPAAPAASDRPAATGLLATLRKRFARPRRDAPAAELPLSVPTGLAPDAPPMPAAPDAAMPASSEAQTARRPQHDSPQVKKNEPG